MKFTIVSGLSGSGKTIALHALEDAGYYCIDNLPIGILPDAVKALSDLDEHEMIAFGIDARSGSKEIIRFEQVLRQLHDNLPGIETELIFIMARENVLVRRYGETRRAHPLSNNGEILLIEAIRKEKDILDAISSLADLTIDTSVMNVHQLSRMIRQRVTDSNEDNESLSLQVQSFGFKHGVPMDSDYVFDVRCLPNPHWEEGLRSLTGKNEEVRHYLEKSEMVEDMYQSIMTFVKQWIPVIAAENRGYLSISIGCTGGQHRSVYMTERVATALEQLEMGKVSRRHRELGED